MKESGQDAVALPTAERALFQAHLFGPFTVLYEGRALGKPVWRRNKARKLLIWFLLNPGTCYSISQLSKLCWPQASSAEALAQFHITLHYLRHLLEPDLAGGQPSAYICRNHQKLYSFQLDERWWIDIVELERYLAQAEAAEARAEPNAAIVAYQAALRIVSQGFLPEEVYDDAFLPYHRHYECILMQTLKRLLLLCQQERRFEDVLFYAMQALEADPYCEEAVEAMSTAYAAWGNVTRAISMLDSFREKVRCDLGIRDQPEIRQLRQQILRNAGISG